jgi:hypothetical protein
VCIIRSSTRARVAYLPSNESSTATMGVFDEENEILNARPKDEPRALDQNIGIRHNINTFHTNCSK